MRTTLAACTLATLVSGQAFAADPKKGSDADDDFMLGMRKVGVMVGEAFACTGEASRTAVGEDALNLATQIATHFGLQRGLRLQRVVRVRHRARVR